MPIDTIPFRFDACCAEGDECGYQVTRPAELSDGTCMPASKIFGREPGHDEARIVTQGAPDQLITPDCETRTLLAFPLVGCCMPNNRCGVSTYEIADDLFGLTLLPAPFTSVECVSVEELNWQFRATSLAGAAQIPPSNGTCDYADLDARLKAADP